MTKQPRAVIYLQPNQLGMYSSSTSEIQVIPFSEGLVVDMEVVGVEALQAQIETWMKQLAIEPHTVVIILADSVYFKKEFPGKQPTATDLEIKAFLDVVPIESETSRVFPFKEAAVAVATNKDFFQPIVEILRKEKCTIEAITPDFVFQAIPEQPFQFTPETARLVLNSWDVAVKYSLVAIANKSVRVAPAETNEGTPPSSEASFPTDGEGKLFGIKRVYVLAGAFGLLLVFMVIYFLTQREALGL